MKLSFWNWPDKIIRKRESRRLREEHNMAINQLYAANENLRELRNLITFSKGFIEHCDHIVTPETERICELGATYEKDATA